MHRFFLPPDQCHPPLLTLTGGEAHHARDVLRLHRGDEVTVLDGAGREFLCQIQELDRHQTKLSVTRTGTATPLPAQMTLIQAIPKGKIFESIIQKSVELGVARIVPLLAERVATRLDDRAAADKAAKWRHTAIEAIKQCGQPWLPHIEAPLHLPELLAQRPQFDLALVGSLQRDGRHPRKYFQEFESQHGHLPRTVAVWIGPEGDFTGEELDLIRDSGARPIDLGPLVLRCETAALYTLSVVHYELSAGIG